MPRAVFLCHSTDFPQSRLFGVLCFHIESVVILVSLIVFLYVFLFQ
jgi:hypothetical protein